MRRIQIYKGDRFTRLEVIEELETRRKPSGQVYRVFKCKCDCGNETDVTLGSLRSGKTISCGCLGLEKRVKSRTKHNKSQDRSGSYGVWVNMISRCNYKNNTSYKWYGGRGVSVCERWRDFSNFYADMGDRPDGMTIDRIDVNGDYSPVNCRWVTTKQQSRNRRSNRIVEYEGKKMSLAEAAERAGLPYNVVSNRIRSYGWSVEKALKTPKLRQGKKSIKPLDTIA